METLRTFMMGFFLLNVISAIISVLFTFSGGDFINSFLIVLFLIGGITLMLGGIFGAIIPSGTFYELERLLSGKEKEGKQDAVSLKESWKKQVSMGKQFTIIGTALFLESILIGVILFL